MLTRAVRPELITVIFPAAELCCPLALSEWYCLVTEHVCERFVWKWNGWESKLRACKSGAINTTLNSCYVISKHRIVFLRSIFSFVTCIQKCTLHMMLRWWNVLRKHVSSAWLRKIYCECEKYILETYGYEHKTVSAGSWKRI